MSVSPHPHSSPWLLKGPRNIFISVWKLKGLLQSFDKKWGFFQGGGLFLQVRLISKALVYISCCNDHLSGLSSGFIPPQFSWANSCCYSHLELQRIIFIRYFLEMYYPDYGRYDWFELSSWNHLTFLSDYCKNRKQPLDNVFPECTGDPSGTCRLCGSVLHAEGHGSQQGDSHSLFTSFLLRQGLSR